jgi:hypothetical protein
VQTHEPTDIDPRRTESRSGVLVWTLVAVIGLAAVVAALILFWPDDDDHSERGQPDSARETTDPAAVQTATAFFDAYSRHDADLTASYLTAESLDSYFDGLESLRLEARWQAVTGGKTLPGRCEARSGGSSGTTVRCPYEFHGLRSEELGLGPYGGNYIDLTVSDGKIVRIADHIAYLTNGFSQEVWEPFAQWVADRHPEDVEIMYASAALTNRRASEESNQRWEQRTQEYVETGGS